MRDASYVTTSGVNVSPVVYVEADEMPDALVPSGNYTIRGVIINVRINLIRNGRPVTSFVVSGSRNDKTGLALKVVKAVVVATGNR